MTGPRRPAEESPEVDPTGIRALLASLPDPGPMPADLVARITAALEQEAGAGFRPAAQADSDDLVPLRRRHRWRTAILAAASVAAVLLVGVPLATGTSPWSRSAVLGGGSSFSGSANDSAREKQSEQLGQGNDSAAAVEVIVRMTGTAYSGTDLVGQARALLTSASPPLYPTAAESPAIGPIGTPVGVRACAEALGIAAQEPVTADVATYDSRPAAVLVVGKGPAATAYVVARTCSGTTPGLMAGPIRLAP